MRTTIDHNNLVQNKTNLQYVSETLMYTKFWSKKEVNFKTVGSQICTKENLMREAVVTKKAN